VNPNATWNVSLESYHSYLQPQEVSKTPTTLGTYGSLPKNGKDRFGFLSLLGVNTTIAYTRFCHSKIRMILITDNQIYFDYLWSSRKKSCTNNYMIEVLL
jgi:hypothetical protein